MIGFHPPWITYVSIFIPLSANQSVRQAGRQAGKAGKQTPTHVARQTERLTRSAFGFGSVVLCYAVFACCVLAWP